MPKRRETKRTLPLVNSQKAVLISLKAKIWRKLRKDRAHLVLNRIVETNPGRGLVIRKISI